MQTRPLVSVLMSMFNAERFLEQAIRSILDQTYKNIEFIIIDDGSKDRSCDIAATLAQADPRICLIQLEKNQGVSAACNVGLALAQGKYIARMDSDDISLPHRIFRQVEFMETHADIGVLGSGMRYMNEVGKLLGEPPHFEGDLFIRWNLLFESPFFNPTVILRKSILDQNALSYDPSCIHGEEDYELWSRLLLITKAENLPDILLYYRLHAQSLSQRSAPLQQESVVNISSRAVQAHLPNAPVSWQEIKDLQNAIKGASSLEKRQRARLIGVYFKIWDEFRRIHTDESGFGDLHWRVTAWAARMILYPLFQPHAARALLLLIKRDWRWPFYLLMNIPYYLTRRRIEV
jgi:glycosyltransferase involved in cell wall biosynthesis